MTQVQKSLVRQLLNFNYEYGFRNMLPITSLANKHKIPESDIYDSKTEKGELAEFVEDGSLICQENNLSINYDVKDEMERFSDYK